MYTHYTPIPPNRADSYEGVLRDALLAQHGGRNRLRLLGDEELHRARLAFWREEATAPDWLPDLPLDRAMVRLLALTLARKAVEDEEARRERARLACGVPRDPGRGWVPEAVVAAIKERLSPVDVFHRWGLTDLREVGRGKWVGRCPFHEDDAPSLYVYTADYRDQHWHCFGCQAHGDVFELARRHTGLSFRECCDGLAVLAGVAWPPADPQEARRAALASLPGRTAE